MARFYVRFLAALFVFAVFCGPLVIWGDYSNYTFNWSPGYHHTAKWLELFHVKTAEKSATLTERISVKIRFQSKQKDLGAQLNCTQVPAMLRESDVDVVRTCAASFRQGCHKDVTESVVNLTRGVLSDFEAYRDGFKRKDLQEMMEKFPETDTLCLIEVRKGEIFYPRRPLSNFKCKDECNIHMRAAVDELEKAMATGQIDIPDTQFFFNVNDNSFCRNRYQVGCITPVLGLQKDRSDDMDVLVPVMWGIDYQLLKVPWADKESRAIWSGTNYCYGEVHKIRGKDVECSRYNLTNLSAQHPDLMKVKLMVNSGGTAHANFTTMRQHADFKYLLQMDGNTASYRMASLMHINSVVLKQESRWEEYYYSFLKPCVHYIPYWTKHTADVLEVLRDLRNEEELAVWVAGNSQRFAERFLGRTQRLQYWEEVLRTYSSLFLDY